MASWTPDQWNTFFIFAGGFVTMVAVQVTNMILSIRNGRKTDNAAVTTGAKIDANTIITKATQASTDGIVAKLVGASSDAAYAAGKKDQVDKQADIQAAVDAATKEKP